MKTNMLMTDRLIRTLTALTFITLFFLNVLPYGVASIMLVVSVIFLVTSYTGFCPFYRLVGFNGIKHARGK